MTPTIKTHYSSSELLAYKVPGLPTSKVALLAKADRESWVYREVKGIGGIRREFQPPIEVQDEIRRRAACALVSTATTERTLPVQRGQQLDLISTDSQRLRAEARKGILTTIERLMAQCNVSREAAMTTLLTQAKAGTLDDHLVMMLRAARDERGRKGDGFPSIRTLKRYLGLSKIGSLAPKKARAEFAVPAWAAPFLAFYQVPQKPSVEHAYSLFVDAYRARALDWSFPSIHQVRRFLGKLGNVSREVGRMGPRELKNIRPFIRRTFDKLQPNDVWSGDGHAFDAEVQHPLHGRPFRPEITPIVDIATRRAVGFSVALAESAIAVLDAIGNAAIHNGLPAIFYVDNGSGYDNALLKDEATGLKGLLGFEVAHSLPYNSQARGVVERLHKSVWVRGAKELPSYIGAQMDREAKQTHFKITRDAIKKGGALPLIGWETFIQFCKDQVAAYNARPHSTLPKINDPVTGKRRHMTPDEKLAEFRAKGWEPVTLTEAEAQHVFRPRIERTVRRGEIQLFNNRYFSGLLEEFHDETVHVAYDIHDAKHVWVHHPDGRFICKAEFGANERHYFPMSFVEQARDKRADARLKRIDARRDEIEAERRGHAALPMETPDVLEIPGIGRISREALHARVVDMPAADPEPIAITPPAQHVAEVIDMPETASQRFARWLALDQRISNGEAIEKAEDLKFYSLYLKSKEFTAQKRRAEETGELPLASHM
ncbi:integrase core domain protein [Burkholderia sp. MSHR3999]|uniref:Mu transposase C-terminal domain-containing protein n=1 Tax=Burkholderia sp. MSHR3999 TaxID=1542965 RepID=UPI0005ACED8A|nr:Mu transposase C-terminal domain-containing protein [Burkholderia sp. MSHR3999]KIP18133.1 integrase core domain protein [Burkholderia sp. MSHR3999]